jgi:NAD(P)-dependent dehydrogenase (short-subunit alcohol dehydrogenase family)
MKPLTVVITGASRGFGAAIAHKLLAAGDRVIANARSRSSLAALPDHAKLMKLAGDASDRSFAAQTLAERRPDVVILNAGVIGAIKPITEQSWQEFSATWNTDVQATLVWSQEAVKARMSGLRLVVMSSGAAHGGSPLTGGYPGAKRTQWIMTNFFRQECLRLGLDLDFTTVLPRLAGDTDLSRSAAEVYGARNGISADEFLARLGAPFDRYRLADAIATLLHDESYAKATTVAIDGDGIRRVED